MQIDIGWTSMTLFPAAAYSMCAASPLCVLGFAFERQRGVHAIGSDRRIDFDAWPGDMALTAPHVDLFSESPAGGEYLALHVSDTAFADAPYPSLAPPRVVFHGDRQVVVLASRLRRLMLADQSDRHGIEEHAALLVARGQERLHLPAVRGRYEPDRRVHGHVLDYIEAALAEPLALADLAQVAAMPPLRFLRSFASATGMTPHAYITERRLQRARLLLRATDDPVAAIAADCGFAHQSHLGALLKQRVGLSPLAYRVRSRATR